MVSFYTMYKRRPVGEYHVGVCTNTLCAVMGGDQILAGLREHLGVGDDEPTGDGKVSLEHVECNAACDYAPVVMVNWEFFDNMTPDSARELVDDLRAGKDGRAQPRRPAAGHLEAGGRGSWPGSPTTRPPAGTPPGGPRWPACASPGSTAGRRTTGARHDLGADPDAHRTLGRARLVHAGGLPALRRVPGAAEGARHGPGRGHPGGEGLRAARPRRRRLPHRGQVGLHPAGRRQAALPGGQRRRVRAGHLQGHPADAGHPAGAGRGRDHRRVCHQGEPGLHLRARRGAACHPPGAPRGRRGLRGRVPGREHPRLRASAWT